MNKIHNRVTKVIPYTKNTNKATGRYKLKYEKKNFKCDHFSGDRSSMVLEKNDLLSFKKSTNHENLSTPFINQIANP